MPCLTEGRLVFEAGVAQLVELQPSKLNVASSSLVSRSKLNWQKIWPLKVDTMRPLKKAQFWFSSRKAKILTTGIHRVF